ncbi:MaoC family dehydratase [Garciella nitratireducens]|uniref:3-hydroxybutyryl-CoA dehydratase n=1 Tax=Garciella nitratireducens DSM 15102 TaxID=1121911 RepID=A0A1T4M8T7_9FIRM|nr:MaoC family dehydratase [Garciella nitratireducens]RBP43978.1 3-hydroxybutyryl-CoA dehydratase [Garciella nitratireducens]SJZ63450.1 3-hydroxybutyryl-CoA dehydratase [Garciella nitratireducens DSM 15102]
MKGKTIKELKIGDKASIAKTITEGDVYLFAGITGDQNPAHINEEVAKNTMFKGRIAHGMLSAGLISAVLGMYLPGPGTIYMGQELKFTAPVRFGDTITAEVEIIEIIKEKVVKLKTTCTNQNKIIVVEGIATVMPPK